MAHGDPIRVFLVDDHSMTRAGMRSLIGSNDDMEVVGDHGNAREALPMLEDAAPDLVLLDITMPELSGIDAIARIREVAPDAKIVMLSHHEGETFVDQSLQQGADGYLSKDSSPEELALAIRSVHRGQMYISPKVTRSLVGGSGADDTRPGSRLGSLTPREREVFQLLAMGYINKEIAAKLGMTVGTAKKHRENLQRKLDCHSAAELARLAIREGLLET